MAAAGLSDLPDDLLRRILCYTPAREGASTAVLSRRWRWLWRTSGAVNLDSRSYRHLHGPKNALKKNEAFTRDMDAALAAAAMDGEPIKKLTLHVDEPCLNVTYHADGSRSDTLAALLANPEAAARGVVEFSFVVDDRRGGGGPCRNRAELRFGSLPWATTLRTLHVTNCGTLIAPPPAGAAVVFPRLAELRLRRCGFTLGHLRRIIDAAPELATLHLESCYYSSPIPVNMWTPTGNHKTRELSSCKRKNSPTAAAEPDARKHQKRG